VTSFIIAWFYQPFVNCKMMKCCNFGSHRLISGLPVGGIGLFFRIIHGLMGVFNALFFSNIL
jgi:hypothetical protein